MGECIVTSTLPHFSLNEYADQVQSLALDKGWCTDFAWLAYRCHSELDEMLKVIEEGMGDPDPDSVTLGAMEFADVLHFMFQAMMKLSPVVDLDKYMIMVMKLNRKMQKKTYIDGKIVRR